MASSRHVQCFFSVETQFILSRKGNTDLLEELHHHNKEEPGGIGLGGREKWR